MSKSVMYKLNLMNTLIDGDGKVVFEANSVKIRDFVHYCISKLNEDFKVNFFDRSFTDIIKEMSNLYNGGIPDTIINRLSDLWRNGSVGLYAGDREFKNEKFSCEVSVLDSDLNWVLSWLKEWVEDVRKELRYFDAFEELRKDLREELGDSEVRSSVIDMSLDADYSEAFLMNFNNSLNLEAISNRVKFGFSVVERMVVIQPEFYVRDNYKESIEILKNWFKYELKDASEVIIQCNTEVGLGFIEEVFCNRLGDWIESCKRVYLDVGSSRDFIFGKALMDVSMRKYSNGLVKYFREYDGKVKYYKENDGKLVELGSRPKEVDGALGLICEYNVQDKVKIIYRVSSYDEICKTDIICNNHSKDRAGLAIGLENYQV